MLMASAFAEVLEWHLENYGKLREHETLRDTEKYTQQIYLIETLIKRHNLEGMMPKSKRVKLPRSRNIADIPCRDAREYVASCLWILVSRMRITCSGMMISMESHPKP